MVQSSMSALAWAHKLSPPFPDSIIADQAVAVRYDGVNVDGTNVIYAVVSGEDLARLPEEVMNGLEFAVPGRDGVLRNSPDAFFVGSERDFRLYVNTEAYPDFVDQVGNAAHDVGLTPLIGDGDLRLMTGPDGDISAPRFPAFIENGMGYMSSLRAISHLEHARPARDDYSGPELS